MSLRPTGRVAEASNFSLRTVIGPNVETPTPTNTLLNFNRYKQQKQQQQQQQQQHVNAQPLSYPNAVGKAKPPSGATPRLTFTIPTRSNSNDPTASIGSSCYPSSTSFQSKKLLPAGYISGGPTQANEPKLMRLVATVDDLSSRLRDSTAKLASAETSIKRGNAALVSERAATQAKIIALSASAKLATDKAKAIQIHYKATTKKESTQMQETFQLQASGAMELQTKYESCINTISSLNQDLQTAVAERETLAVAQRLHEEQLGELTAELEATRRLTAAECSAAAAAAATTAPGPGALKEAELNQKLIEAVNTNNCLRVEASNNQTTNEEYSKKVSMLTTRVSTAEASAVEVNSLLIKSDLKLAETTAELTKAIAQHEQTKQNIITDSRIADAEALIDVLDARLHETRGCAIESAASATTADADAETPPGLEEVARACASTNVHEFTLPDDLLPEFHGYIKAKSDANDALVTASAAGAGVAQLAVAARMRMMALQAHRKLSTNRLDNSVITRISTNRDNTHSIGTTHKDGTVLTPKMTQTKCRFAVSMIASEDCTLNTHAHGVSDTEGFRSNDDVVPTQATRTAALVSAISMDLKKCIMASQSSWNAATETE
jgi:hypothetical protein